MWHNWVLSPVEIKALRNCVVMSLWWGGGVGTLVAAFMVEIEIGIGIDDNDDDDDDQVDR